ncbi:hypothetical protein [Streptomyces mirabilis]|uniref:hypothetical protein n=1 Tax=Streptomyces mirabilis TaxID=68239 RepID=UPI0032473EA5
MIQMFGGYAGTPRSGFRAEAQQEQALARGERLATMLDGHEHHRPARGPSSASRSRGAADRGVTAHQHAWRAGRALVCSAASWIGRTASTPYREAISLP